MTFPLRRVIVAGLALALAACADPTIAADPDAAWSEPEPVGDTVPIALAGAACPPEQFLTCQPGQCGMVPDGCRGEMWCGDCACGSTAMSCELAVTQLWEHTLTGPGTFTIEVTTVSPASIDPVMHVIQSTGTEVAFDDNSAGGTRPRLTVSVPSGQTRIVVLRPKTDTPTGGVASVTINGAGFLFGVRGRRTIFASVRAGEEIESIQLPGSSAVHTIYGMSNDGEHITQRVTNNGTAGGAVLTQPNNLGARVFWFGSSSSSPQPTHVIRNDRALSGHDAEPGGGDGLGLELEAALGLCNSPFDFAVSPKDNALFYCSAAVDVRDTDGDGLSDGLEVRGKRTGGTHQPLRRWGANPRHKDLFAEVDGAKQFATDVPPHMSAQQARYFSDTFGDRLRPLTASEAGTHALSLRNPDGKPGISTHLDIGISPIATADRTVYGNWGGHSEVPPDPDGSRADEQTAWLTHMATNRRAVFRYAHIWNGVGGSTPTGVTCLGCGSYAWASSNSGDATQAHEAGHAHGIAHSGAAGYHDFVDPNCKANWPSIESYAFTYEDVGFADGTGLGTINNAHVVERDAFSPYDTYTASYLSDLFRYTVVNGSVDWNRDGVIAPSGATVRAYTNFVPGNNCEFTRYNSEWLPVTLNTSLSPAFGRLGVTSYVFAGGTTFLRWEASTSAFDCPLGITGCGFWGFGGARPMDTSRGVDAARVTSATGQQALLVVGIGATGVIRSTMLLDDGTWTPVVTAGIVDSAEGQPALETLPDGRALLVYEKTGNELAYGVFRYDGATSGFWMSSGGVGFCDVLVSLTNTLANASPGLARTSFTGIGPRVWLMTFSSNGLRLTSWDVGGRCVRSSEIPRASDASFMAFGRPVGIWVPDATNAMGGRLTILGVAQNAANVNEQTVQQLWSYVNADGVPQIGQVSGLDSGWTYGYGVDGWYDEGVDDNLRAIWSASSAMGQGTGRIRFQPRADGINDFDHLNWNDWEILNFAVCRSLVNPPGGGVSNPISCPDRPW